MTGEPERNADTKRRYTYFDRVWDVHTIESYRNGSDLLFIDLVVAHEITTPPAAQRITKNFKGELFDPQAVVAVNDHVSPANDSATAIQAQFLRDWAKRNGIRIFDVGDNGIAHVLVAERAIATPGATVICGDSHTCTLGALGAIGIGVGSTAQAGALLAGCIVVSRPNVMQVDLSGSLHAGVTAKDAALHMIKRLGVAGARGFAIEFTGSVIGTMTMDERLTICNMAVEAGATTAIIAPDKTTQEYTGREFPLHNITFEQKLAVYDRTVRVPGSDIVPLITWGTNPAESIGLDGRIPRTATPETLAYMGLRANQRLARVAIDQVFIGSCTNSRISDLRLAASILRGRTVRVPTIVTPGSQHIKRTAEREGLHDIFQDAGILWTHASCGPCLGMSMGVLAPGMRCVSTSNRNFPGRMGTGGRVHLASPAVAAVAAVLGRVPNMEEYHSMFQAAQCK